MRAIVILSALLLMVLGTYCYVTYDAVNSDLTGISASAGGHQYGRLDDLRRGKKKSVFFIEFGGDESTDSAVPPTAPPIALPVVSSSVQANPLAR